MQDWLAHRARTTPDREALVNASSGNAWTYATLDETVEEMAGRLAALGVTEGDHLGAVLETGVEEVCLIHAAMRLGAVLAPLSPEFTPAELSDRLDRADVDAVVCDADTESGVRDATGDVDSWLPVFTIDDAEDGDVTPLSSTDPAAFRPGSWERADTQLLLFTSGTTGTPKVVRLTMGNLLASATASAFRLGIDPEDRWLVPLSLHHMGGIAPILRSTLYGTTVIVREQFDPGGTVDDLRAHDATCVSLVPTMLRRMLSARGTLPDSLRFVLVGGAPCPTDLIERCRDYSVPICPTYGMTETASQVATARHTEAYEHPESVGRPLLWTDVTVVDADGSPVETGETGELVVSGPTVTPGYYGDPAATGEAMGAYGLHTGDVGYRDERGRLYVLNRLDDRIITGGENVDPGEVVDALRAHESVQTAAVVGLDDETWGEEVAALVVPDGEAGVDVAELEPFLRDRLAGFKLPRRIGTAESLPRTVSGTVERAAVRERLREGETGRIGRGADERDEPIEPAEGTTDGPSTLPEADTDGERDQDDAGAEDRRGGAALSASRTELEAASGRLTGIGAENTERNGEGEQSEPAGLDEAIERAVTETGPDDAGDDGNDRNHDGANRNDEADDGSDRDDDGANRNDETDDGNDEADDGNDETTDGETDRGRSDDT